MTTSPVDSVPAAPTTTTAPASLEQCSAILARIRRHSAAGPFLHPVDPIALNIPDYLEKIKHPMDLSTIKSKLTANAYPSPAEFDNDIELMFNNCFTYNEPGTPVHELGQTLRAFYRRLVAEPSAPTARPAEAPTLSSEDFNHCSDILSTLTKSKYRRHNWPFLAPVREEDAPGYFSIIKHPMDLETLRTRLDSQCYSTLTDFIADLLLIFKNCQLYNAPGTEVYERGKELEKIARNLLMKHMGSSLRIVELRDEIKRLSDELETVTDSVELARKAAGTESGAARIYSLKEREEVGKRLLTIDSPQAVKIAQILCDNEEYGFCDDDEVEADLYTLSDEVFGEILAVLDG